MLRTLIVSLAAFAAACGPSAEPTKADPSVAGSAPAQPSQTAEGPEPVFQGDPCSAELFQDLIGQPRSAAEAANLPAGARIVGPGDSVTMDHRPERLNVRIGVDGTVETLGCG